MAPGNTQPGDKRNGSPLPASMTPAPKRPRDEAVRPLFDGPASKSGDGQRADQPRLSRESLEHKQSNSFRRHSGSAGLLRISTTLEEVATPGSENSTPTVAPVAPMWPGNRLSANHSPVQGNMPSTLFSIRRSSKKLTLPALTSKRNAPHLASESSSDVEIKTLKTEFKGFKSEHEKALKQIQELQASSNAMSSKLESLVEMPQKITTGMQSTIGNQDPSQSLYSQFSQQLNDLQVQTSSIERDLEGLPSMKSELAGSTGSINTLFSSVYDLKTKINSVDNSKFLSALQERCNRHRKSLDEMQRSADKEKVKLNEYKEAIQQEMKSEAELRAKTCSSLQNDLSNLKEGTAKTHKDTEELVKNMTETAKLHTEEKFNVILQEVQDLKSAVKELESSMKLDDIKNRLTNVEASLNSQSTAIPNEIKVLAEKLDNVREDFNKRYQTISKRSDNIPEDINERYQDTLKELSIIRENIGQQHQSTSKKLDSIKEGMEQRYQSARDDLQAASETTSRAMQRLVHAENGIQKQSVVTQSATKEIQDISSRIASVENNFQQYTQNIRTERQSSEKDIADIRGKLVGIEDNIQRISELEDKLSHLESRMPSSNAKTSSSSLNEDEVITIAARMVGPIYSSLEEIVEEHNKISVRVHGVETDASTTRSQLITVFEDKLNTVLIQARQDLRGESDKIRKEFQEQLQNVNKPDSSVTVTQNDLDILRMALRNLESRYENMTTDAIYQKMVHWFAQSYPNAQNSVVLYRQLGQDFAELKRYVDSNHSSREWMDTYRYQLSDLAHHSQTLVAAAGQFREPMSWQNLKAAVAQSNNAAEQFAQLRGDMDNMLSEERRQRSDQIVQASDSLKIDLINAGPKDSIITMFEMRLKHVEAELRTLTRSVNKVNDFDPDATSDAIAQITQLLVAMYKISKIIKDKFGEEVDFSLPAPKS